MPKNDQEYTIEEKIKYYTVKLYQAEMNVKRFSKRLKDLETEKKNLDNYREVLLENKPPQ